MVNHVNPGDGDASLLEALGDALSAIFAMDGGDERSPITVSDPDLLFKGQYKRTAHDLLLTDEKTSLVIYDYFRPDKRADLRSPDGAVVGAGTVEILAGPQNPDVFAQATPPERSSQKVIGRVEKASGNSTAIRNGVSIVLNVGDLVYENDAVQTSLDGSLGISFLDGTAFSLSANARMILNRMVYDGSGSPDNPISLASGGASNASLTTLIQGKISFVAGQIAKTGDMKVNTPVGTLGIRGTAVHVVMESASGIVELSLMREPDGRVGVLQLYSLSTGEPLRTITSADSKTILIPQGSSDPRLETVEKTPTEILSERIVVADIFEIQAMVLQTPVPRFDRKAGYSSGTPEYAFLWGDGETGAGSIGGGAATYEFPISFGPEQDQGSGPSPINLPVASEAPTGAPAVRLAAGLEDTAYKIRADDLLKGFTDRDGGTLAVEGLRADHGRLTPNSDGTWTFEPEQDYNGPVTLDYRVVDGQGSATPVRQRLSVANVNDAPTGSVTIKGSPQPGQVLTVSQALSDPDGIPANGITYQWFRGDTAVAGATGSTYKLSLADVGQAISVQVRYTDGQGTAEAVSSRPTVPVATPPEARDDRVYIEVGGSVAIDVAENDTDADGNLDLSSITIVSGPSLGSAMRNPDGTVVYSSTVANRPSPADESAVDTFVYRIQDGTGQFDQATVQVNVVDPLREVQTSTTRTATDQNLFLTVATEGRTANSSSFVDVDIQIGNLGAKDVNIALVFDASGSVSSSEYAQQLAAVQNTINLLRTQFSQSINDVKISLIRFASGAQRSTTYDLDDPALNDIRSLAITPQTGGSTNYEAALAQALAFFGEQNPNPKNEANFLFFASDGGPSNATSYLDEAAQLKQIASVSAVGFGSQVQIGPLDNLDNTGGAQIVPNAGALGSVFATSPLFNALLVDFDLSLSVNGAAPKVLAGDVSDLVDHGNGSYSFDLAAVSGLLGRVTDTNIFKAQAVFDTDGDLSTTADRVTIETVNKIEGVVPVADWRI
jgi:hypothetical protein